MAAHEVRAVLARAGIEGADKASMNYEEGGRVECWKVAGNEIRMMAGLSSDAVAETIIGALTLDRARNPDS